MAFVEVICVHCGSNTVVKNGKSASGEQRFCCRSCLKTFQLKHKYKAYDKGVKQRIVDMAMNGSGIRDTARVLSVAINTVMSTIKKRRGTHSAYLY